MSQREFVKFLFPLIAIATAAGASYTYLIDKKSSSETPKPSIAREPQTITDSTPALPPEIEIPKTILTPQDGQILKEGEIAFQWSRPKNDSSIYEINLFKDGKLNYFRKTIGTRRTKYLAVGSYEFQIKTGAGVTERIAFRVSGRKKITVRNSRMREIAEAPLETPQPKETKEISPVSVNIEKIPEEPLVTEKDYRVKESAAPAEYTPPKNSAIQSDSPELPMFIWGGVGSYYLGFEQDNSTLQAKTNFSAMSSPAYSLGAELQYSENSKLQFNYHTFNVEIRGVSSSLISTNKSQWKSTELLNWYHVSDKISLVGGLTSHEMPWLSARSDGTFEPLAILTQNLNGGFGYSTATFTKVNFEGYLTYQFPFLTTGSSGGKLSTSSYFSLNGSLSAYYNVMDNFSIGLGWVSQYHKFNYSYDDKAGNLSSGSQIITFSSSQIRLRYGF